MPAAVLLLVLVVLPTLSVLILSAFDWDLGARSVRFVGVGNFVALFQDGLFWASLDNTMLYTVLVTPVTVALGLALAIVIESRPSGRGVYRTIHLLPVMAAFPAMAMAWEILLHPTIGPLNAFLAVFGVPPHNWLRDRTLVLPTLMVIGIWQHLGWAIILFIGGLKAIPRDLYDAAEVDGAHRPVDRFFTVILPGVGPVAVFVATLIAFRALETFDKPRVLTHGGPGYASETLMHTLFTETFVYLHTGFGAALTTVFLVLAVALAMVRRILDERVHYT